jgi:Arc/MetJ-type ribon-helix-helix transcriptional regulator
MNMTEETDTSPASRARTDAQQRGETEHFGFYVDAELKQQVHRLSLQESTPESGRKTMSDIGREALREYLARRVDGRPDLDERRGLQEENSDPDESDRSDTSSTSDPAASRVEDVRQLRDDE